MSDLRTKPIDIGNPASGHGARVSAHAGLINQLHVVGSILALHAQKTLTQELKATGGWGWGTPRPVLLTGAKKSHLGCLISFELSMDFQNSVVIKEIHP